MLYGNSNLDVIASDQFAPGTVLALDSADFAVEVSDDATVVRRDESQAV